MTASKDTAGGQAEGCLTWHISSGAKTYILQQRDVLSLLPIKPPDHTLTAPHTQHPQTPNLAKDKWQQEKSTSVLTVTAFRLPNKLQSEGWSHGSGGRHAVLG